MGFLTNFFKKDKPEKNKKEPSLVQIKSGGMIRVINYGPEMETIDVQIERKNMYSQDKFCWYELQGQGSNGQQIFIEIDQEDQLEIDITLERDLPLPELGVSFEQLEKIDDLEAGEIKFRGKIYEYDDSDEAFFYRDSDKNYGRKFYYWDFYNEAEGETLSIKKFERGSEKVTLMQSLREDQIEIISSGV
jgi:hypothetical protein